MVPKATDTKSKFLILRAYSRQHELASKLRLHVHSCQQKSIGLKFSKSQTGSDVGTVAIIIRVVLLSPYMRIRAVSPSSIYYNQSHRVYINRRRQYICLI